MDLTISVLAWAAVALVTAVTIKMEPMSPEAEDFSHDHGR